MNWASLTFNRQLLSTLGLDKFSYAHHLVAKSNNNLLQKKIDLKKPVSAILIAMLVQ